MKLELKNIKHSDFASQETFCYEAKIYLDGKPLAHVENDGRGGSDLQLQHPSFTRSNFRKDFWDIMREIDKYFEDQPTEKVTFGDHTWDSQPSLESWCYDEVHKWLLSKDLKRSLKKGTLIQDGDKLLQWKGFIKSSEIKKHHPKAIIFNDLPFDKALETYVNSHTS